MTEENKKKLGHYIGAYRTFAANSEGGYSQKEFGKENETGQHICGTAKLRKIEKGEETADEEIYIMLLKNLGKKFDENINIDYRINDWVDDFYSCIEKLDKENAYRIVKELGRYKETKSSAIYKDFFECIKMIADYEFDGTTIKNMKDYINAATALNISKVSFLVGATVTEMNYDTLVDPKIMNEADDLLFDNKQLGVMYTQNRAAVKKAWGKHLEAGEMLQKTLNDTQNSVSTARGITILTQLIGLTMNYDPITAIDKYGHKIMETLKKEGNTIPKHVVINAYQTLGLAYYKKKEYCKSLDYIKKAVKLDYKQMHVLAPYYCECIKMLGGNIEIDDKLLSEDESHYAIFYNYYVLKYGKKAGRDDLIKYIRAKVKEGLFNGAFGLGTVKIFKKEIKSMASSLRGQSQALDFVSLMDEKFANQ